MLIIVYLMLSIFFAVAVPAYADQGTEVTAHIETAESSASENSAVDSSSAESSEANRPTGTASGEDSANADTDSPHTGDSADILLHGAILFIIGVGVAGMKVYVKKQKIT